MLLAAASDALAQAARKHGVAITPPALHVEGDRDATSADLDDAIAIGAGAAHASPSEFAYDAIDAMAKATNDRYTQFFTPDEFKAFNEALDPERIGGIGVLIEPDVGFWLRPSDVRFAGHSGGARRTSSWRPCDGRERRNDQRSRCRRCELALARQSRKCRRRDRTTDASARGRVHYARRRAAADGRFQDACPTASATSG